ncbi:DUF2490 domain-containing protein [Hwangdonia lutea]|uniref:DUF2490 domain-containing protein n=1 Tax=Hwangdonia lutea TaxID=3075823 RepID=A0AA97HQ52_9FLAO|nr:DUF2490 domain-containing protein [Hwangdonia sp. SCSIO 19198]WOD43696.1 DUF2490 domain-containing protein [Hwangdonia sp. SCSIO 19198]
MKKLLLLVSLLMVFNFGYAQINPEDKLGTWYELGSNHKISDKTSIDTYTQVWLYELNDNFNFFLFKLAYNYHFNPKLTATMYLGYSDFDGDINVSAPHTYERRITEQISFKHKLSKIPLDHRFRIEHRFFRKHDSKPKAARLRYRLGTKFNLNKTVFVRLTNELLLTPKFSNTPENRFYTGLGFNISKSHNIQLGYMNRNTSSKANLHRIQVGMYFKTDFRKNKS